MTRDGILLKQKCGRTIFRRGSKLRILPYRSFIGQNDRGALELRYFGTLVSYGWAEERV